MCVEGGSGRRIAVVSWRADIRSYVQRRFRVGEKFTTDQVYADTIDALSKKYPNNRHVPETIRDTLQLLRDDGVIEFRGGRREPTAGIYKRLK
jgi:hypothetical protein